MKILQHVETLKNLTAQHGNYRRVAELSGVNFHWLQKFAIGAIQNPTIENIAKLQEFFESIENKDAA